MKGLFDVIVVGAWRNGEALRPTTSPSNMQRYWVWKPLSPPTIKDRHMVSPESFGRRISKILPMFRSYYELTSFGMSCKMRATRRS